MHFNVENMYNSVFHCCMAVFVKQWEWNYPLDQTSFQNVCPLVMHSNCHPSGIIASYLLHLAHQYNCITY